MEGIMTLLIDGSKINNLPKMYFIDSNILIEISKFYYYGKCSEYINDKEIKEFVISCRQNNSYVIYMESLVECAFDYGDNMLNQDVLNKFMIAIDNLIMYFSEKEILSHHGVTKPWSKKRNNKCNIKHIRDCNLPNYIVDSTKMYKIEGFYCEYLYMLKINELYSEKIKSFDKVRKLFDFMINEVGCFSSYDFILGLMLYIGNEKDLSISKGILKVDKKLEFKRILNSLLDIFLYRNALTFSENSIKVGVNAQTVLVTGDKEFYNFSKNNYNLFKIGLNDIVRDITVSNIFINDEYYSEYEKLYKTHIQPKLIERMLIKKLEAPSFEKLKRLISNIEDTIYKKL